jgi:hypothetical protein
VSYDVLHCRYYGNNVVLFILTSVKRVLECKLRYTCLGLLPRLCSKYSFIQPMVQMNCHLIFSGLMSKFEYQIWFYRLKRQTLFNVSIRSFFLIQWRPWRRQEVFPGLLQPFFSTLNPKKYFNFRWMSGDVTGHLSDVDVWVVKLCLVNNFNIIICGPSIDWRVQAGPVA